MVTSEKSSEDPLRPRLVVLGTNEHLEPISCSIRRQPASGGHRQAYGVAATTRERARMTGKHDLSEVLTSILDERHLSPHARLRADLTVLLSGDEGASLRSALQGLASE